ncbi:MAG: methyltransferase domain-containing protein [Catenulispora sp.]|nr:methyltransferase domain-containing protein [Catenulispora sp.]
MWADSGVGYEAVYAGLCAHTVPDLLDLAAVRADTALLDVGTGTGTVARAAVARGAKVTAIDAEPTMLDLARAKVPEAEFHLATVPDLPFDPATFDAVVGNFVLNHFGKPRSALAALCSTAKPGGRVAFTVWPAEPPAGRALFPRAAEITEGWVPSAFPAIEQADNFPRTEAGLADLLGEAGLEDVRTTVVDWEHQTTVDEWWISIGSGIAGSGRAYLAQKPEVRARFRQSYLKVAAELSAGDGTMRLPYRAILGAGTVTG